MKKNRRRKEHTTEGRTTLKKKLRMNREVNINVLREKFTGFMDREDWGSIIKVIVPMLKKEPHDHWLLVQLAGAYIETLEPDAALKYAADALWIQPDCPLARWVFAHALAMRGQPKDSIEIFESMINDGAGTLSRGVCGRGSDCNVHLSHARSLITDTTLSIGITYLQMGYRSLFRHYRDIYKENVANGIGSAFSEQALKDLRENEDGW